MESRLDGIMDWARAGRQAGFRVDRLSQLTGASAREVERYFRAHFDVSPKRWMDRLRMKDSQRLLRRGLSIKEVAGRLGFEKPQDFARAFKRVTRTSPRLWRILQQAGALNPLGQDDHPERSSSPRREFPGKKIILCATAEPRSHKVTRQGPSRVSIHAAGP